MTLGRLIDRLKKADQTKICENGFDGCYSYRGWPSKLAFHPAKGVAVATMLSVAVLAVGKAFHGYKGGSFVMELDTDVYLCESDAWDEDPLTESQLDILLGEAKPVIVLLRCIEKTVGKWLSASLEDPIVCKEMKDDVNEFFRVLGEVKTSVEN